MADIIDDANERAERFLAKALRDRQRNANVAGPIHTGACLYCAKPVPAPKRWCDAACRDEWQRETKG